MRPVRIFRIPPVIITGSGTSEQAGEESGKPTKKEGAMVEVNETGRI